MFVHFRKTFKTVINKGQHPILGSSKPCISVKKFIPRPGTKTNRMNEKIDVDPNEKVDHDFVSITFFLSDFWWPLRLFKM